MITVELRGVSMYNVLLRVCCTMQNADPDS